MRISDGDADWLFKLIGVEAAVVHSDSTGKSPSVQNAPANVAPGV